MGPTQWPNKMRTRTKPPEIYVSHFKTLGDLIELLNSRTPLGEKVRSFIDKLRRVPGRKREPLLAQSAEALSLKDALREAEAELNKYRWIVGFELFWGHLTGRMWNIRPNLDDEYQTWLWAVLDYDRLGDIDRIRDCAQCAKTFVFQPRGRGKYCSRRCVQQAHRSRTDYRERAKRRNRRFMQRRRLADALESATSGRWERLGAAGYTRLRAGICRACGARIEWWRTPPRRKTRGRRPRRVDVPVQKIPGSRVRTHWPHQRS